MKRPITIVGNWKMHKTIEESVHFIQELIPQVKNASHQVFIAPAFTAISACAKTASQTNIVIGAQNMSDVDEGAFTGEISARMLKEAGAHFVILGHSERRNHFHETNEIIHHKLKRAILEEVCPILCIGESEKERQKGHSEKVLRKQLDGCLEGLTHAELHNFMIAYEPIWAIGTGKTATPKTAQETHAIIRQYLIKKWDAESLPLLYGGSVKPENIQSLLKQPDIDGALIGGASLDVAAFAKMVST